MSDAILTHLKATRTLLQNMQGSPAYAQVSATQSTMVEGMLKRAKLVLSLIHI